MNEITVKTVTDDDILKNYHQYTSSGLNNYWLSEELYVEEKFEDEVYYSYPQFDNIMATIGLHICKLPRLLGPREVRFLRVEMKESQQTLAHKIGYSDDQVISKGESLNRERHKPLSKGNDALVRIYYLLTLRDEKIVDQYLRRNANVMLDDVHAQHTLVSSEHDHLLVA